MKLRSSLANPQGQRNLKAKYEQIYTDSDVWLYKKSHGVHSVIFSQIRDRLFGARVLDMVRSSQAFSIEITYQVRESVSDLRVGIYLYSFFGELLFISFDTDDRARHKRHPVREPGHYVSRCHIPANVLNKGAFMVGVSASVSKVQRFFWEQNSVNFTVDEAGGVATQ